MDEEGEGEAKVLRDGITRGNVRCMQPRREKEREERVGRSVARGSWRKEEGKGTSDRSLADELRPWAANREKIEGPPSSTISSIPSFFPFNSLLLPPPLLPFSPWLPLLPKGRSELPKIPRNPLKSPSPRRTRLPFNLSNLERSLRQLPKDLLRSLTSPPSFRTTSTSLEEEDPL